MTARSVSPPITLSVGIPTFNQADYLEETLRSLLEQSAPAFEIVVSDNHCTDGTSAILERFAGAIRVVRPERHLAMAESWNFLLSQLRGSWFTMLSSDDVALPNFVESLTQMAGRVPDAVLVRGGYQVIDGEGRISKSKFFRDDREVLRYPDTLLQQLRGPHTSFSAFAARTEVSRSVGGFLPEDDFAGDWSMWIRLSPLGAFVYTPAIFSQYRVGYRSEVAERARYLEFLRVQPRIYREVIAGVVTVHGQISGAHVDRVSRARCRSYLAWGSQILPAEERAAAVALIRDWAHECDLESELTAFAAGETVERTPRSLPATVIRNLGRRLRSLTGRRRRDYSLHEDGA